MQLDLQNLRELIVNRRHRPWCRTLDGAPGVVHRNRDRAPEPRVVVKRRARRILTDRLGALEHLLRGGEISNQFIRSVRKFGVGIDRELRAA